MDSSPASWLELIGGLVGLIGTPAVAIIAYVVVTNRLSVRKRKSEPGEHEPTVTRGLASFLTEKVADVDRHTKEGFRETLGGLNAIAHGVDKLSEQTARLDRVWGEELQRVRHEIERLPEQIELRIQAARSRHGD